MKTLLSELSKLKKNSVSKVIARRLDSFQSLGKKSSPELFKEMCFCLLTANYSADKAMKIQENMDSCFYTLSEPELAQELKKNGHRFPNTRASYIFSSQKYSSCLKNFLTAQANPRKWLVENIKGLGYKEASHFLRNIGYMDYAIIDFHIIDLLVSHNLIERPKTLSPKKYLEIESILSKLALKSGLSLGELDLYLWYLETGKVLK